MDRLGLIVGIVLALLLILIGYSLYTGAVDGADDFIEDSNDTIKSSRSDGDLELSGWRGCRERCSPNVERQLLQV